MKWVAIVVGVLVALVLIVVLIGAMLPKSHVAVRSARFHRPAADLFRTVTEVATAAGWRKDIQRIEMLPPKDGRIVWREVSKNGTVSYEGEVVRAPMPTVPGRFISRITDKDLPYGGEWIIDVANSGDGSLVTVTENGEVYNPIFRFVSKFIMGQTASIDGYLRALGRHVGEEVTPGNAAPV
jgi:hypothetical protein